MPEPAFTREVMSLGLGLNGGEAASSLGEDDGEGTGTGTGLAPHLALTLAFVIITMTRTAITSAPTMPAAMRGMDMEGMAAGGWERVARASFYINRAFELWPCHQGTKRVQNHVEGVDSKTKKTQKRHYEE